MTKDNVMYVLQKTKCFRDLIKVLILSCNEKLKKMLTFRRSTLSFLFADPLLQSK